MVAETDTFVSDLLQWISSLVDSGYDGVAIEEHSLQVVTSITQQDAYGEEVSKTHIEIAIIHSGQSTYLTLNSAALYLSAEEARECRTFLSRIYEAYTRANREASRDILNLVFALPRVENDKEAVIPSQTTGL